MGFGVCLLLDEKFLPALETAVECFKYYGWVAITTCPRDKIPLFEGWIRERKLQCMPFNTSPEEIFSIAALNDFNYFLTVGTDIVNFSATNNIHILLDEKCTLITTEPDKPTSRSFEITSHPETWHDFIIAMINDGSPLTASCLNEKVYVFKNNSVHNKSTVIRTFNHGKGFPAKIRIKPLWNFSQGSDELIRLWSKYFAGTRFQLVDSAPDYWLVINCPLEAVDPHRTIYFMMEPHGEKQYAAWLQGAGDKLLFRGDHAAHLNNCEWHCSPEVYGVNMPSGPRENGLCIIISDKATDPGQKYRIAVAKYFDDLARAGALGFPLEIWGKCRSLNFFSYKGELPPYTKDSVLSRFKYHFNAENNAIANYITEKLYDSVLCGCYTFYWGAPNTPSYFPPESYCGMSGNLESDCKKIIAEIQAGVYESKVSGIKLARDAMIRQYSMPARLEKILELTSTTVITQDQKCNENLIRQGFKKLACGTITCDDLRWIGQVGTIYNQEAVLMLFTDDPPANLFALFSRLLPAVPENIDIIQLSPSGKANTKDGCWYLRPTAIEKAMDFASRGVTDDRVLSAMRTVVCKL
jgi:hypothetical protein